jgi:hypothetical protein
VHHTATPRETALDAATARVHYTPQTPEHEPVPVRIVSQGGKEFRPFSVIREQVAALARCIVGQHLERSKVTIQNLGTVPIWIGPGANVGPLVGFRIDVGGTRDLTTQASIWAVSDDGTPQNVAILVDFSEAVEKASAVRPGL